MSNHRDRNFLDLAHRVTECQLQLPGCQGYAAEGCEPAHANGSRWGKGLSMKAHDAYHAAACHNCHAEYDQGHKFNREQKQDYWQRGYERTMLLYLINGWLKVN